MSTSATLPFKGSAAGQMAPGTGRRHGGHAERHRLLVVTGGRSDFAFGDAAVLGGGSTGSPIVGVGRLH